MPHGGETGEIQGICRLSLWERNPTGRDIRLKIETVRVQIPPLLLPIFSSIIICYGMTIWT